jgi:hypothetical protein
MALATASNNGMINNPEKMWTNSLVASFQVYLSICFELLVKIMKIQSQNI